MVILSGFSVSVLKNQMFVLIDTKPGKMAAFSIRKTKTF